MNFVELLAKGGLPEGATSAMASALDRRTRGKRVTAKQADLANRLIGLIEHERACRQHVDWQLRDEFLRKTQVGAPSPVRPGAASSLAATPRAATAAGAGPAGGGGLAIRRSAFDARTCSPQDLRARISQLGLDSTWYQIDQATEDARRTRQSPSIGLLVKEQRAQLDAAKRQADRSAELAGSAINARDADPAAVRRRLDQLGLGQASAPGAADIRYSIREKPRALEPLPPPPKSKAQKKAEKARRAAERRDAEILAAAKQGAVDARKLSGSEAFRKLLELRGLGGGL